MTQKLHLAPQGDKVSFQENTSPKGEEEALFLALNEITRKESNILENLMNSQTSARNKFLLSNRSFQAPVIKKISQAFLAKYIHDQEQKNMQGGVQNRTIGTSPPYSPTSRKVSMLTNFNMLKEQLPPIGSQGGRMKGTKKSPKRAQEEKKLKIRNSSANPYALQDDREARRQQKIKELSRKEQSNQKSQFIPGKQLKQKELPSKRVLRDRSEAEGAQNQRIPEPKPNYSLLQTSGINLLGQNLIINSVNRAAAAKNAQFTRTTYSKFNQPKLASYQRHKVPHETLYRQSLDLQSRNPAALRHSCEISPKQRFTQQYREWVEKFPIKELDNYQKPEEGGGKARMENASTQSPDSKEITVNMEKLERLTRRVGDLKMRQSLNQERQRELDYKERKMNMQRATVNALKQCAIVLDIHSTALRKPQKLETERKPTERYKQADKKIGSPQKQTREQKKRDQKIEKALKERLEKLKPKPQVKILPPIALKGITVQKQEISPQTSKPSFIPSITLYHKPRMGRTSRDQSPEEDIIDLGELDSPIEQGGKSNKPLPFSLTSGQYYHKVNVMGNERRGSLLTGQKSRSPIGGSTFNKKKKVQISVKKIGTPVYSKAQKIIKGHTRGYPSLTPIKVPHLSVYLDQEIMHRSLDDNYPSRQESQSPRAQETIESIPLKTTYEDAITSLLFDQKIKLQGWEEDRKSRGFDTLNALDFQDRFSKD